MVRPSVAATALGERAGQARPGRLLPRWLTGDHPFPWLAPLVAVLLALGVYPLLYALWLTFQERSRITRQFEFVGLIPASRSLDGRR
jgi:multiple sugar transport system permease protein